MAKTVDELRQLTEKQAQDIRDVMATEGGRRVIYKLLERAGLYRCSFNGQSNQTIFNEGGRNQGLMLLSDVTQYAPTSYQLMLKENNNG